MGKYAFLDINETKEELNIYARKYSGTKFLKRINALKLIENKTYKTRQEVADHLGISKRTLENWINKYTSGGIKGLCTDLPRNKPSKLINATLHDALEKLMQDNSSPIHGYNHVQEWIKKKFGLDINYHTLRHYLKRHFKTKLKQPRKSHVKKYAQAIEAFLKTPKGI